MIGQKDKLTPYVKKLFMELVSKKQVDAAKLRSEKNGTDVVGEVASELALGGFSDHARAALRELNSMLMLVRGANPPNPWRNSSDEDISRMIIEAVENKRSKQ